MTESSHRLEELYHRVDLTRRSRFAAFHRLQRHERYSQWTVTLLSVALVGIPLMQALGLPTRFSTQALNAIQVFLAVAVLAYSLLIGQENYSLKAEKMHQSGLELGKLTLALEAYIGGDLSESNWKHFTGDYDRILRTYENHLMLDYKVAKLEELKKKKGFWSLIEPRAFLYWSYSANFAHYLLPFMLMLLTVWALFGQP